MTPLITYPVFRSPGYSDQNGHGRNGQTTERDDAPNRFSAIAEQTAAAAEPKKSQALATPRDALDFLLQTEMLPGPGSAAPYLAQQIGQLWIAPDARFDHSHAATAYQRANQAGTRMATSATEHSVIV